MSTSRFRNLRRTAAFVGLILVLIVGGVAAARHFAAPSAEAASSSPATRDLLLRTDDLQIGYWNYTHCGELEEIAGTPPKLRKFIHDFKPEGCLAVFTRMFSLHRGKEPDPSIVGSVVLEARSSAEADAALEVLPELVARVSDGEPYTEVPASTRVGGLTRLFHLEEDSEGPTSALVWRSGNVVAGVLAAGNGSNFAGSDATVAQLAGRQQARIEMRTPAHASDNRDVALDDPHLGVDVRWLGTEFRPGHGLPSAPLFATAGSHQADMRSASVLYNHLLLLGLWKRSDWQRQAPTFMRRLGDPSCTRKKTIALAENGRGVLYVARRDSKGCPRPELAIPLAYAYFGKTVVKVSAGEPCVACEPLPFDSERAILTILHSLRPRQPRPPR